MSPIAAQSMCHVNGCSKRASQRGYCEEHLRQKQRSIEENRDPATRKMYDDKWARARRLFLNEHPLCAECMKTGRIVAATVVHHVVDHRGDHKLFWDSANWQPLCKSHHDAKTMSMMNETGKMH